MAQKLTQKIFTIKTVFEDGVVTYAGAKVGQNGNRRPLYLQKAAAQRWVDEANARYQASGQKRRAVLMTGTINWTE